MEEGPPKTFEQVILPKDPIIRDDESQALQKEIQQQNNNNTHANPKKSFLKGPNELNFDNLTLRSLPIDPINENYVRKNVTGALFSKVLPTPLKNPKIVAISPSALELLDLDVEQAMQFRYFADYLCGNKLFPGSEPAAHCYCGHQFGHFAGQLGDGRAMYLGEVVNHLGERWEMQLKGAGKTPYSRTADGRAVLRSSIREFLCSEAMYHLGIPTTRAGSCVTSETTVIRDIYYSGNPISERATVVMRIAPTFLRFGSFEVVKEADPLTGRSGPSAGKHELLIQLLDYTIKQYYPLIWNQFSDSQERYLAWYREIVRRTARLVAEWQCVGFVHGVLNTDNMSAIGVTIDYGPFGFVEAYNPDYTSNGSDDSGRYSLGNQPGICKWNLGKLGEMLSLVCPKESIREIVNTEYDLEFEKHYQDKMRKKLGLMKNLEGDSDLIESFLDVMQETGTDFTNAFRNLNRITLPRTEDEAKRVNQEVLDYLLTQIITLNALLRSNRPTIAPHKIAMLKALMQQNPAMLSMMGQSPAGVMKEIEKAEKFERLQQVTPEARNRETRELWSQWLQKYQQRLYEEVDANANLEELNRQRVQMMNSNNPKIVLRNHLAQSAIEQAEKGYFREVNALYKLLQLPYAEKSETIPDCTLYYSAAPEEFDVVVT